MENTWIDERIRNLQGKIGIAVEFPTTGWSYHHNAEKQIDAASLIKLPIMAEAFRQRYSGKLDWCETVTVTHASKMPSCGALSYMHDGLAVTIEDLVMLMIIHSDNTATNMLIDILGMENINREAERLEMTGTRLNRKLFDSELAAKGIENYTTAADICRLLRLIGEEKLISRQSSNEMLDILLAQRLNGKIPFFLHEKGVMIAHKTGEDIGITHDCAIVLGKRPFIMCFLSEKTDVPQTERAMQDMALKLYEYSCG